MRKIFSFIFLPLLLAACLEEEIVVAPKPVALSIGHNGYFCSMTIVDHPGPKAQIHVMGEEKPLWFSQVRDMFGFIMLPGESREITALYVTDMSGDVDWNNTNNGPWINPVDAWFVIDSNRKGGMGALEVVPFSIKADAENFSAKYGGQVLSFGNVPSKYVFDTSMQLSNLDENGTVAQ